MPFSGFFHFYIIKGKTYDSKEVYQCPFRAFFISMISDEILKDKQKCINALFGLFSFL